jgi:hypothetical protein
MHDERPAQTNTTFFDHVRPEESDHTTLNLPGEYFATEELL